MFPKMKSMRQNIVQWNCKGLLKNVDIFEIWSEHNTDVMCLLETHLNANHAHIKTQYTVFKKDRDAYTHSSYSLSVVTDLS